MAACVHVHKSGFSCTTRAYFTWSSCSRLALVSLLEKGLTQGLDPVVTEHFVRLIVSEGEQVPKTTTIAGRKDYEVTIANYHCSALFVSFSRVRYGVCQHGGFDFRLAPVARTGTERRVERDRPAQTMAEGRTEVGL